MNFEYLKKFNNKAIDYLIKRLKTSQYRGQHLVQHYRYNFDNVYKILKLLDKYTPNKSLLAIRTADLTKVVIDLPEWKNYVLFCKEVRKLNKKGTQDSIRKIIFVDLERMGLINRYNENKILNQIHTRNKNYFVNLTEDAYRILDCKNELDKNFLIAKYTNNFLNGCIENILEILKDTDNNIDSINTYEYMFFMTAIDDFDSGFALTQKEAIEYIKEYRNLEVTKQKAVVEYLKKIMIPKKGDIKGKNRKDFHNWKNETESLFKNFLKNIIYFNFIENGEYQNILLSDKNGIFDSKQKRLERNLGEKQLYMKNHNVSKKDGFELHHIIPLAWSTSLEHFKLLDNWLNMIYIDAYSHRKIRQHIILQKGNKRDLKLLDYGNNEIYLKNIENVLYDYNKRDEMIDKNETLR